MVSVMAKANISGLIAVITKEIGNTIRHMVKEN